MVAGNGENNDPNLVRTSSQMSDKPLSDDEFRDLERSLAQAGHTTSMLERFQTSTGVSSAQLAGGDGLWPQGGGEEGGNNRLPLRTVDTMDTNPLLVSPMEVQGVQQQVTNNGVVQQLQHAPCGEPGNAVGLEGGDQSAGVQQNTDGTIFIPLQHTQSGTEFFRTESGTQYQVIETPAAQQTSNQVTNVKQETTDVFPHHHQQMTAPHIDPQLGGGQGHPHSNQQAALQPPPTPVQTNPSIEDVWSSMVEANNEYNLMGTITPAPGTVGHGGVVGPPTGDNPVFKPWKGQFNFEVTFQKLSENAKSKSWDYSAKLKKLFIDANKEVMAAFNVKNPHYTEGLYIRMLPVYADSQNFKLPVARCPRHASLDDSWNRNFNPEHRFHLIRAVNKHTIYETDATSERLSCKFPVDIIPGHDQVTVPIKFMCLGSDIGGLNRRPLMVIFTLETSTAEVLGRARVDVRVCSCPRRDKATEEEKKNKDEAAIRKTTEELGRRTSSFVMTGNNGVSGNPPSGKKRKHDAGLDDMILVPVARANFENVNQIAEALMIAKDPSKAQEIKETRRRLLMEHNPNTFTKRKKPEKKPDESGDKVIKKDG